MVLDLHYDRNFTTSGSGQDDLIDTDLQTSIVSLYRTIRPHFVRPFSLLCEVVVCY